MRGRMKEGEGVSIGRNFAAMVDEVSMTAKKASL
jgi:hypothetical protein